MIGNEKSLFKKCSQKNTISVLLTILSMNYQHIFICFISSDCSETDLSM